MRENPSHPCSSVFHSSFHPSAASARNARTRSSAGLSNTCAGGPDSITCPPAMTAALYLLMSYPLSLIARRLEKRFPKVVV